MTSPSQSRRKRRFAGFVAVALLSGVGGFALARLTKPPPPQPVPTVRPASVEPEEVPLQLPVMDRRAILLAITSAADRHALGVPDGDEARTLAGRSFEVRIAFGCDGPSKSANESGWRFETQSQKLTVHVTPDDLREFPPVAPLIESGAAEAAEGYWISRPWAGEARCVAAADPASSMIDRSAGLVQIQSPQSSRVGRRAEPLTAVKTVEAGELRAGEGFELVLSGRIARWPGAGSIRCHSAQPSQRPSCLIAVKIDEVAIDGIATGERIARWTS